MYEWRFGPKWWNVDVGRHFLIFRPGTVQFVPIGKVQDHRGTCTPIWKYPFILNKREVKDALIKILDLRPRDGLCSYTIDHPYLEAVSILMITIIKPKVLRCHACDSIYHQNYHEINLMKYLTSFHNHLSDKIMLHVDKNHLFLLLTR